ncbi:Transcriptional regulator, LysR family [Devosia sp. LC5]|uniref:LysR substrate-binding domain-containing protein n=1 Tax=Devosia sp. LC5 TaxID=1502724 RepID=UPI0004E3AAAD|nr:LysR family transcriptional regulator [Devosia sp. LC5]KFC62035.1 Transcriptional regulator, LysR family [Devosia sp. LC5]
MPTSSLTIELRHLRYFVATAEHGSFRKAGVVLGLDHSAVSRRIRDLEDHLGASLFNRHNGGVCLTLAGEQFLPRARKALRSIGDGARHVAAIGRNEEGRIRIGIFSSLASGYLSDLMRAYSERHSRVRIEFYDGDPAEHIAAVRQVRIDVAFLTGVIERAGCDIAHLWSERVFVVLPEGHLLAKRSELDWSDLLDERFIVSEIAPGPEIQDYLVQRLAGLGRHPEIELQAVGRDNLLPLVALGRGLTLTSEATTAAHFPGIVYRPIRGECLPFSAIWSPVNDNPSMRRLLSMARSMAKARRSGKRLNGAVATI